MKKIILSFAAMLLIAVISLTVLSFTVWADTATEIKTAADLKAMSSSGNYKLANDITLTEAVTVTGFSGTFDGNGKTISGLSAPLFTTLSGRVSNLTLKGEIDISGKTEIASLAITLASGGVVDSCTSEVVLTGSRPSAAMTVGGLVAFVKGNATVKNSVNFGHITVTGAYNSENSNATGGIVGRMDSGATVIGCTNFGTLYANGNGNTSAFKGAMAGIVGITNGDVTIRNCLNEGNIKASSSTLNIAGILGRTETTGTPKLLITNCVNKGTVEKTSDLGERPAGIVSYLRSGTVEWCANFGTVTSNSQDASGIVGYYNGSNEALTLSYNFNAGNAKSYEIIRVNGTGKLTSVSNFYRSGKSACNSSISGAVPYTDAADLTAKVTALSGSPFVADLAGNKAINNGYPIAIWQCTHDCDTVLDAELGELCGNCGTVVGAIDCAHTFGNWTVVKEATDLEDGLKTRECSKCHAIESEIIDTVNTVTPVGGVYNVKSAGELIWLFNEIENGAIGGDVSIKLTADIDVKGSLNTLTVTFTGTFDGNGKTVLGISNTLFTQFNGTAKNLTLRGDIDYTAASNSFDVARKAASFAHSSENASFTNLVSYVNIKTARNDLNAGGIVGYAKVSNTFLNCAYNGNYTVTWSGDTAGIGGIVGWNNASGGTTSFIGCTFGGTITVKNGVSGKDASIGGILGNCTNAKVVFENCTATGTIKSEVTAGNDYVGGILGVNRNAATTFTGSVNRASLSAKSYAGGIVGGISEDTKIDLAANYGTVAAPTKGAIVGTANGKTLIVSNSADLSGSALKLSGTTVTATNSFTADKVSDLGQEFTFDGIAYKRYNVCVAEKESGRLVTTLTTTEKFAPYVSIKDEGDTHSIRFVILTNRAISSESVTVSILFKDDDGKTIKSKVGVLSVSNSDYTLYSAVKAAGEKYFAAHGNALFGCVITDIPNGIWSKVEVMFTDTATGAAYGSTYELSMSDMQLSPEIMPDFSSLGNVSATYNAGPGLLSDRYGTTAEDCLMKVISNTTARKLADYTAVLEANGYKLVNKNVLDDDQYYTYEKYGKLFYLYYNAKIRETRIIVDNASDKLSEINVDYTPKAGDTTEFYQYSINYEFANKTGFDPVVYTENTYINCGMLYIIKLADNSVVVVDGGHEKQSTAKSRAGLMKFLREITGTAEGEKVKVSTWFFSHAHGDHVRFAADFIDEYYGSIDLLSVTYNFPSYQLLSSGYDGNTFLLKENIAKRFPNTLYHKLHTGEVMNMAGVSIDVVYTHEDAVTATGSSEIGDFNSTSTVLKIKMDGMSIMLLGDISGVAESAIVAMHTPAYLKSDAVQVAHHGFNSLNTLYPLINAKVALFPQSMFYMKDPDNSKGNLGRYQSIMTYSSEEYFAHKYTYKFTVVDGAFLAEPLPRYDAVQ